MTEITVCRERPAYSCSARTFFEQQILKSLNRLADEMNMQGARVSLDASTSFHEYHFICCRVMPVHCPGQSFTIEFEQEGLSDIRVSVDLTGTGDGVSTVFSCVTKEASNYLDSLLDWFRQSFSGQPGIPMLSA